MKLNLLVSLQRVLIYRDQNVSKNVSTVTVKYRFTEVCLEKHIANKNLRHSISIMIDFKLHYFIHI